MSRYRNRVEFRARYSRQSRAKLIVDIGTEWNLELTFSIVFFFILNVDIGTEWNLETDLNDDVAIR